jgi:hypothetical protein
MTMDRDHHPALMMGANLATGNEVQGRGAAETEALSEGFDRERGPPFSEESGQ